LIRVIELLIGAAGLVIGVVWLVISIVGLEIGVDTFLLDMYRR
jgi:hypothetical protein